MPPYVRVPLILLIALLIAICSLNTHSFWIDEAFRYLVSTEADFAVFLETAASEKQFLFHWAGRLWGQLLPSTEIAFRCLNIPFYLIGICYVTLILKELKISQWWGLLIAAHPFLVYYLNDYSPYLELFACITGVLFHAYYSPARASWWHAFLALWWMMTGFGFHFIFGFAGFIYLALLLFRVREAKSFKAIRHEAILAIFFAPLFAGLLQMYLHHMAHGADRGWDAPGLANLSYTLYGLIGMQGLGLTRNDLRAGNFDAFTPGMGLMLGLIVLALLALACLQHRKAREIITAPPFISSCIAFIIFVAASSLMHFHYWERHCVWLFPVISLGLVQMTDAAWHARTHRAANRGAVILLALLLLASSARGRYMYYYQKDDFKNSYAWVQEYAAQQPCAVLLQGHQAGQQYYRIADKLKAQSPHNTTVVNVERYSPGQLLATIDQLLQNGQPVCLVLSEKNTCTPGFYKNPQAALSPIPQAKIHKTIQYNTFKIIILNNSQS